MTEQAYADRLRALQHAGEILWHRFEGIKLCNSGRGEWDGAARGEGFWQDDASAKTKVAVDQCPFRFIAVRGSSRVLTGEGGRSCVTLAAICASRRNYIIRAVRFEGGR